MSTLTGDYEITGTLRVNGLLTAPIARSNLISENTAVFPVNLVNFRVHDAMQTNLPALGAADDLGIVGGVYGTTVTHLKTQDLNAAGAVTEYARAEFTLPAEYVSGGPISVRVRAGMLTAVASVSGTVDVQAFLAGGDTLVSGADLCTTAAQSANSLVFANYDFTITPTSRVPGEVLDLRLAWIGNSATASAHHGAISAVSVLLQIKG